MHGLRKTLAGALVLDRGRLAVIAQAIRRTRIGGQHGIDLSRIEGEDLRRLDGTEGRRPSPVPQHRQLSDDLAYPSIAH
jgi:hypothetical protein